MECGTIEISVIIITTIFRFIWKTEEIVPFYRTLIYHVKYTFLISMTLYGDIIIIFVILRNNKHRSKIVFQIFSSNRLSYLNW